METELQDMLNNIEREYPGYDEYRVNADEIEHDPYVLISILSAWHEGVFTLAVRPCFGAVAYLYFFLDRQDILFLKEHFKGACTSSSVNTPSCHAERIEIST